MNEDKSDFEEITLAIGLLGGLIAVLLKISDYSNNHILNLDPRTSVIVYSSVGSLFLELIFIFMFLIFKGIFISKKTENEGGKLKETTETFFYFIFIYPFIWLILSTIFIIITIILKSYSNDISILYILILSGTIIFWWLFNLNKVIKQKYITIVSIISITFIIYITIYIALIFIIVPTFFLMGSYSIEEFLQPNSDNIAVGIKETGIISNVNFIFLYKLDTDFAKNMDEMRITYSQVNYSSNGSMVGTNSEQLGIWYLNINTSKLQPGNYLLHAEVTLYKNPSLGVFKKQADKLFYIPPRRTD